MTEYQSKVPVSLRVDFEVLEWYRKTGRGWQTRMHDALELYMADNADDKSDFFAPRKKDE